MLKTACILTGDNYQLLAGETPASKKKVVAMSLALMVPVLIWVFNGFMLSFQVLKAGFGWSILTAFICGVIVFVIEKLIIMANGNSWLTLVRICIGLIVSLLGSIAIDEVVFREDIDISVAEIKEQTIAKAKDTKDIEFRKLKQYGNLEKNIADAKQKFNSAEESALAEADGTKGTKTRGVGEITLLKNQKALERKADRNSLLAQKNLLDKAKDSLVNISGKKAESFFKEHALLTRIKALFHLVVRDNYMLSIYILFTLLMFFFEFLVVILKLTWKKTNYERKIEMIEYIGQRRMEYLQNNNSPLNDPGNFLPHLSQARNSLQKNSSLYN